MVAAVLLAAACEPYPGTGTTSSGGTTSGGTTTSGRQLVDAEALCTRLVDQCGQPTTKADCVRQFTGVLVTSTCASAIASASCAQLTAARSMVLETCFPACNGTVASCNGDGTITVCTSAGTTNVRDCDVSCRVDGFRRYSGTCGLSYQGQVSDRAQCWCE